MFVLRCLQDRKQGLVGLLSLSRAVHCLGGGWNQTGTSRKGQKRNMRIKTPVAVLESPGAALVLLSLQFHDPKDSPLG